MKRILFTALMLVFSIGIYASQELPLEYFIKHGDYLNLKLSPDGKHIAARVRHDGRVFLAILDSDTMEMVGGVKPFNNDIIHHVSWVNNERLVYEYAEKQSYIDSPVPTGELFAVNLDGSKNEMLYGYRASDKSTRSRISSKENAKASQKVLSLLENDDEHILIIEYPWTMRGNVYYDDRVKQPIISKLNIHTGRKRKIDTLPHGSSRALATKNGQVKFMTWTDEKGDLHSAFRDNNDAPWTPLGEAFEQAQGLTPLGLSEDSKSLYLSGRYSEEGIHTLYSLDLQSGEYTRIFGDHKTDIESVILDGNGMPAVGITYPDKSAYEYAAANSRIKTIHKKLTQAFEGQTVNITSSTKDRKTLLVHVSSDINPGEYYLFDSDSLNARFVWANSSWIDPRTLQPMHPIAVPTEDGETLHGYLTLPPAGQSKSAKPPLVVLIHGGPHQPGTRDFWRYDAETQLLANRGFAVLRVNFRGSDGYGTRFERLGYREWGGAMIKDINDAVRWTASQGLVDSQRICAYGASYGGYAALMSVVRAPDLYRCTIGYVGVYDLQYMYSESDIPNSWGGRTYLKRVLGTDAQQLKEYSPIHHVNDIKAKVMLIHGSKDKRVPEINSEVLAEKLEQANNPAEYLQYAQAGHGVFDEENRQELYQGLLDFLNEHLK
ncbi:Dipeptidyl aminopeptidase/acylaminoacyl peptidase [Marisediminitalea aggregata]|uniref:Dipeptidyl aminopeptidase/acylaminoacyl peptidase n=1 Tax=Marisediminitalea aggregata TaxID=634436 RepID=A0A1M5EQV6_9ALTE|nr:S9 family peptidase [Marisediminitalea aggregata]SHF81500.1 Dipeptidyl aminopeptidase/acylaminoacyl peptidase [Marisediminitalea aggregata]